MFFVAGGYRPVEGDVIHWFVCKRCGVKIQRSMKRDGPVVQELIRSVENRTCEFCGLPRAYTHEMVSDKKRKDPPEQVGGPKPSSVAVQLDRDLEELRVMAELFASLLRLAAAGGE